jgi:hypothetical protein
MSRFTVVASQAKRPTAPPPAIDTRRSVLSYDAAVMRPRRRGFQLRSQRAAKTKRNGWAQSAWTRIGAPLAVGLATLAIIAQLLAPASHRMAAPNVAAIAAELKATFGEVAVLCVQAEDDKSPRTPTDPARHCDDCCPLCRLSAGAHALVLPTFLGAPTRIAAASETLAPAPVFVRLKPVRTAFARPRAPPLEA